MATLISTASSCHGLRLPPIEKDDRLNLNVRTGSASTLYNSFVFTFGGLTLGLELEKFSIKEVEQVCLLKINNLKSARIDRYLSGEFFSLSLLEKRWSRVEVGVDAVRPKPRLLHEMCAINNCVYIFGGLVVNEEYDEFLDANSATPLLRPINDLWELNLETALWTQLHDGLNHENDPSIPTPRFHHKFTTLASLPFVNKGDHFGIFIAGGRDKDSNQIFDNAIFDLVTKTYVDSTSCGLSISGKNMETGDIEVSPDQKLNVDYYINAIISFTDDSNGRKNRRNGLDQYGVHDNEESIIMYTRISEQAQKEGVNPLVSFKVGKSIKYGRILPLHRKMSQNDNSQTKKLTTQTIPYNLRYPTGGLFGRNLVITGFLPNEYDISIFVYNKPTGKWSRLNIFCDHDYGSHRFWGGFAWQSHHKVVLLGNSVTSKTTSSIRFFNLMVTVNLPITNILASLELEGGHYHGHDGKRITDKNDASSTDDSSLGLGDTLMDTSKPESDALAEDRDDQPLGTFRRNSNTSQTQDSSPSTISFSQYVHYVAPKTNFTTIRSVFPPAAITLGRNALDRYGDVISDFEIISATGDRIPVSMMILMERWGRYFIELLARGYVKAVDKFEKDQQALQKGEANALAFSDSSNSLSRLQNKIKYSASTGTGSVSSNNSDAYSYSNQNQQFHISIPVPQNKAHSKEAPHFRLPFQDSRTSNSQLENVTELQNETSRTDTEAGTSAAEEESDLSYIKKDGTFPSGFSNSDFHQERAGRQDSISSFSSNNSLLNSHLQNIPPQLPLPNEPTPAIPTTSTSFRSSSRKNSNDHTSPRASLLHTLTALRSIPVSKSPKDSPFSSPRASISAQAPGMNATELSNSNIPNLKYNNLGSGKSNVRVRSLDNSPNSSTDALSMKSRVSDTNVEGMTKLGSPKMFGQASLSSIDSFQSQEKKFAPLSSESDELPSKTASTESNDHQKNYNTTFFNNPLLDFESIENGKFKMEPSLIPRKLYMPFSSNSLKEFCEYLYTGQVGNKWLLSPTTLDNLIIAKYFNVPLLYDLISEVLFGIIGRKESYIIREGNKLKRRYKELVSLTNSGIDLNFTFPLDEYEGFMDTIDDGYLDLALLKKSSESHKDSTVSAMSSKNTKSSVSSFQYSFNSKDIKNHGLSISSRGKSTYSDGQESLTSDQFDEGTIDLLTSSEEESDYELGYLDFNDTSLHLGPRAKSVFDKSGGELFHSSPNGSRSEINNGGDSKDNRSVTLEQLVSPHAPLPSDTCIDVIFETATVSRDIKLILRASNVKYMGQILNKTRSELGRAIEELENRREEQIKLQRNRDEQKAFINQAKGRVPSQALPNESDLGLGNMRTNGSSSSLSTMGASSLKNSVMEKTKSNPSFRSISNFTPFKGKTEMNLAKKSPMENNKELDKRITKLIRKDEKQKMKNAKDEKLKRIQDERTHFKSTLKDSTKKLFAKKDANSPAPKTDKDSISSKKSHPHGFLHHLGSRKHKDSLVSPGDNSLIESSKLTRTQSSTGSISSANSKSESFKLKHGIFGMKKSSG